MTCICFCYGTAHGKGQYKNNAEGKAEVEMEGKPEGTHATSTSGHHLSDDNSCLLLPTANPRAWLTFFPSGNPYPFTLYVRFSHLVFL